jgi:hypothetical protein
VTPDPMQQQQPMAQGLMAQQAPPVDEDAQEAETFEAMVASLTEHLTGPAGDKLIKRLKTVDSPAQHVGVAVFQLVKAAADEAAAAQRPTSIELLLGVASDVIESIMRMAQAAKIDIGDPEDFMAEALFSAVQAYGTSAPQGSEEQEAAKAMLADMQQDGTLDEGVAAMQEMGAKAGVDPFAPKQNPMAQGVRAGLMGNGNG